jgi:hypothetical protein
VDALAAIYAALGGDEARLAAKPERVLRPDFLLDGLQVIEVDEVQHSTSERARTLELDPPSVPLGFDLDEYLTLRRPLGAGSRPVSRREASQPLPVPGRPRVPRRRARPARARDHGMGRDRMRRPSATRHARSTASVTACFGVA